MSRVLVFSRDPGGANTVIPLVGPMRARGWEVLTYGKDAALIKYRQAGLEATDLREVLAEVTPAALTGFLSAVAPDLVITGTSADDFTEKFLWQACEQLGIPCFAVLDQWINYGLRFSAHGVNDIALYRPGSAPAYLPTRIVAMDDYARTEMVADGLPEARILVCGQPYFETVRGSRDETAQIARFCEQAALQPDDFVVVFASEPITTTYGPEALSHWGYSERSILTSLVGALERTAADSDRQLVLVVRPHPKEGVRHFADIVGRCRRVRAVFDTDSSPWTLINRADLVCGMSSMFLLESAVLQTRLLSIQIGLCRQDPFILSRRGLSKSVLSEDELARALRSIIILGDHQLPAFEVILDPVRRIITEMEKILCRYSQ